MISENLECTQAGDVILFESTPIWGFDRDFVTFSDSITGQLAERYFNKQFRYSFDGGIVYMDWMDLSDVNLSQINVEWNKINGGAVTQARDERSDLKMQFKYTRAGETVGGNLKLNSLTINGTAVARDFEFKAVSNTIFADIINNNIDVFNMTLNIVEKMYEQGIIPEYLDRKKDEKTTLVEDKDYIDFWKTIAEFYVVIFTYVLRFTKIYWTRELLCEYLAQKGIIFCKCADIIEMQQIAQNFYDEIRQRGTTEIFYPKNHEYPAGNRFAYTAPSPFYLMPSSPIMIDGIKYTEFDELPYGWLMISDDSAPLYQLISPDTNYHQVLFCDILTGQISIQPSSKVLLQPTEYSSIFKAYNGEYLRLICYNDNCDEFIFNQVNIKDFGWNVGNSSPLYRGLDDQYGSIVKAYEKVKDFTIIGKYPWFGIYDIVIDTDPLCTPPIIIRWSVTDGCSVPIIITSSIT